jgi:hypothetical protein
MARNRQITRSELPAAQSMKRPTLLPSVDTSYPTLENLDAQHQWLAHIAAGRITCA